MKTANSRQDDPATSLGWEVAQLKDLCERITKGSTPTSYGYSYKTEGIRFVKAENIDSNGIAATTTNYIDEATNEFLKRSILKENDLLFSIAGTIGRIGLIRSADLPANTNQALAIIRLRQGVLNPKYLFYYLKSDAIQKEALSKIVGVGRANLSLTDVGEFEIPVAPLDQQKRIVSEIEKQFSRLDEAVANLKRVKANLKRYKAAVLKAAVEGKLTEEWRKAHPDVEPASELLKRILAERRAKWEEAELAKMKAADKDPKDNKWKTKYEEAELVDNEPVSDIPSGWLWASLDTLIVWGPQNGLYLPKSAYRAGIAILRIDDYQDGKSRPSGELQQVAATQEDVQKYSLEKNDLVINRVNSPSHLGKCLVVQTRNLPSLFESNMMRLKLASDVDVGFVELYLRSDTGKNQLIKNAKWAVNQASINQEDVRSTVLPLPPLIEQKAIVKEAERLWSLIGGLDEAVNLGFKRAERLRQSILCQAFQGRLLNREYKPKSTLQQDFAIAAESPSNYRVLR